jgi:hypothetical protein
MKQGLDYVVANVPRNEGRDFPAVMAGFIPAIHVLTFCGTLKT